jgi:hypothetical protein
LIPTIAGTFSIVRKTTIPAFQALLTTWTAIGAVKEIRKYFGITLKRFFIAGIDTRLVIKT